MSNSQKHCTTKLAINQIVKEPLNKILLSYCCKDAIDLFRGSLVEFVDVSPFSRKGFKFATVFNRLFGPSHTKQA